MGLDMWIQCQGHGYANWVVDHAVKLGGAKLLNPQKGEYTKFTEKDIPVAGRIVHEGDADKELVYEGASGADVWFNEWFWPTAKTCSEIDIWCGPNEPVSNTPQQAQALNSFIARLADRFHEHQKKLIGIMWSTGHPSFAMWTYMADALKKIDYLGRHSYSCSKPWFDPDDIWHAYRLVQDTEKIRELGYRIPPIVLDETGIDRAGNPETDGWQARGVESAQYADLLWDFAALLKERVPELVAVSPFLWLSTGWPSFDIGREASQLLVDEKPQTVTGDIDDRIRRACYEALDMPVPYNTQTAFHRHASEHFLGAPQTPEVSVEDFVAQGYPLIILKARKGQWDKIEEVSWQ